jgi:nanoRNase/pAp phosphatase (c-di-AMP/oligoRNAs hydrolase)
MQSRLVVGCGQVGHALVESLAERPGELLVLEIDERRVERLRETGVAATEIETVDAATIRGNAEGVDSVIVADDGAAANLEAARAAREAFPDAMLLVYAGHGGSADVREDLSALADKVVDPGVATTEFLQSRVGDEGHQLRQLRSALWDVAEPLAIVTHDNPDPDAIASGVALQRIAASVGIEAQVCYYGQITHQENRAFINLLEFELRQLDDDEDLSAFGGVALVDHSRPGVNDQLPTDTPVDIVIDHHPPKAPIEAEFVDVRSSVGATSTLLAEYLQAFGITLDEAVATGLLFGIRIDTKDFTREVSIADFEAAAILLPAANIGTLERIESPSISGETLETIARAIQNRDQRGSVLTSCVGELTDRDSLAQAADRLLTLEGVQATVVYGVKAGLIYISGRARGIDLDLGETLREAFDQIGSAGGHADMAGAQIQLENTMLEDPLEESPDPGRDEDETDGQSSSGDGQSGDGEETTVTAGDDPGADGAGESRAGADPAESEATSLAPDLETFITERFFEALDERPNREVVGLYASSEYPETDTDW